MPAQQLGERRGRRALPLDAHLQRLQAAQEEPGGVRRRDDPRARAQLEQPRGVRGVEGDDRAQHRVVVAGQVFRRGVEDEVAAALERL
jgi:hypothetical protein